MARDMSERRLVSTWETLYKDAEGEGHIETLHKYDYDDERGIFTPAVPARIRPSRAKPVERDHELYFVFSDAQVDYRRLEDNELLPIHDERKIRAAQFLAKSLRPDTIINLGDTVDLASLSRFKADSDHFHRTLGPAFQAAHDMYAQFRADNPQARIIEVDSNHNTRLRDFVLKNMPQMYGMRRAGSDEEYPVMTYPYLANLAPLGVEWVGGYGAAEHVNEEETIAFRHGRENSSNGTTASKILKNNPDITSVQGHDHTMQEAWRTTRNGRYIGAIVVGALCKTTGEVPGYHSAVDDLNRVVKRQENHQSSVAVVRDYGDGKLVVENVPIHSDGTIIYQGNQHG